MGTRCLPRLPVLLVDSAFLKGSYRMKHDVLETTFEMEEDFASKVWRTCASHVEPRFERKHLTSWRKTVIAGFN